MKLDKTGFPMMSKKEVEIIDKLIEERKPATCLEWGSGNSTVYFTNKHKCIKHWLSIEHLGNYVKELSPKVDGERVSIVWVPTDVWYVDCVKHQGRKYDFILVDGLNDKRESCLAVAHSIAKEKATILLHDSGREAYQGFIRNYGKKAKKLSEGEQLSKNGFFAHRGLTIFQV